jgi:hypothetical protein
MTRPSYEEQIADLAHGLAYPPCPDMAPLVLSRLPAGAPRRTGPRLAAIVLSLLMVLLGLALAVPTVRAAVFEILEVGIVRILLGETGEPMRMPTTSIPAWLPDLAGQVTLEEARAQFPFPIRLPTVPPALGDPDLVFLQELDGAAVILVWLNPEDPAQVGLSLQFLTDDASIWKLDPALLAAARVNGQEAYWTSGPYLIVAANGERESVRLVEGHVLIWTDGELTYRLESDLTLEEAVQIAESLH